MRVLSLTDAELKYDGYDSRLVARKFWFSILSGARNEDAVSLRLNPALGDNCLLCTTSREEFSVLPPPEHVRDIFVVVGCDLITGGSFLGKLRQFASRISGKSISGAVKVQEHDRAHTWIGIYAHPSITFRRINGDA